MVALIFAATPAKAGDNSIDVAVIVYDGVLTSDITAPLESSEKPPGNSGCKKSMSRPLPRTAISISLPRKASS